MFASQTTQGSADGPFAVALVPPPAAAAANGAAEPGLAAELAVELAAAVGRAEALAGRVAALEAAAAAVPAAVPKKAVAEPYVRAVLQRCDECRLANPESGESPLPLLAAACRSLPLLAAACRCSCSSRFCCCRCCRCLPPLLLPPPPLPPPPPPSPPACCHRPSNDWQRNQRDDMSVEWKGIIISLVPPVRGND